MNPKQAGILLVEPLPLVRKKVASFLAANGLPKVTSVSSPREALELLETKPLHLILCEWRYDDASSLEFLQRVRSHNFPRIKNICFVVLTADAHDRSVHDAMTSGADDYILKPLNENQIQTRIHSLLMKVAADQ